MAIASTTLLLIAAGLSAASAVSQGKADRAQADFQARINEQQAQREREVSDEEERDFRKVQSANLAERRAALGKSGVDLSSGSPLLASSDFAAETELQAQRIRRGGETKATRLGQQADFLRQAGKSAQQRGFLRGGASLLSGYGKAFK